jgi:hypothetical protein
MFRPRGIFPADPWSFGVQTVPRTTGMAETHRPAGLLLAEDAPAFLELGLVDLAAGEALLEDVLGSLLMHCLIDHARRRGLRELLGHVRRENARMLGICRRLGFREEADPVVPRATVARLAL